MCLARAYFGEDEASPVLEDVARLTIEGDKLRLTSLFGEEKEVHGKIKEIDFMNSRVVLEGQVQEVRQ
ncbi:MAG: CooT family nickel-binding protein [Dehalococcoidia bacterium]